MKNEIYNLYLELLRKHGKGEKFWPQWCAQTKDLKLREIIAIGAILTQRTSWHNADLALKNLKKENLLSLKKISDLLDFELLTKLIRPAGFYQSKPKRLFEFSSFIINKYGNLENFKNEDIKKARSELLSCYGIDPETADTLLLYSLDRPSFIVDAYTKRLVKEKSLVTEFDYDHLKKIFEKSLPLDIEIYQNFHTLIIVEQKGEIESKMEII